MMNILRLIVFAIVMLALAGVANGQSKVIVGSSKLTDSNEFRAYRNLFDKSVDINYGAALGTKFTNMGNLLEIRNDSLQLPGTVSTTNASNIVNGHSTEFDRTFRKGEYIEIGGVQYRVITVSTDTTIVVSPTPSVTQSHVSYNNPNKREVMTIAGTGKVKIGNSGSPVTSSGWLMVYHDVYAGHTGKWTSNTGFGNFLALSTDSAVTNSSLQTSAQLQLVIGAGNKATYTGDVEANRNEVQVISGASGTASKAIVNRVRLHNESATFTISNGYGIHIDSAYTPGPVTKIAAISIGKKASPANWTALLIGAHNIPTGQFAIVDSSGYSSFLQGELTTNGLDNYGSNIAGSYTERSKVDKNYVDSLVSNSSSGVTEVTGTSPISVATGTTTPVISMTAASATDAGYITTGTQTIAGDKTLSGMLLSSATLTDPGNSNIRRLQSAHTLNFTSAAYTGSYTSCLAAPIISSTNTQNWTNSGNSINNGGLAGFTWNPQLNPTSGTMTLTGGFLSSYNINMAVTTVRQFHAKNPAGSGAITNLGSYVTDQLTRGTNNAGFQYGNPPSGTFAFYNSTSDNNDLGTGRTIMTTPNIRSASTPSGTADASGSTGDMRWDADYIYVKTAAGWKRAALSTW